MRPEDLHILKAALQDSLIRVKTGSDLEQLMITKMALDRLQVSFSQEAYKEFLLALAQNDCLN